MGWGFRFLGGGGGGCLFIYLFFFLSKLQVLSFMFTSNFRRCPLAQKLTSGVLYLSKSCTFCPLDQTQLDF
ncbi:hypothetical protein Hanom_Chr15g01348871 [Helianthus anomalus]